MESGKPIVVITGITGYLGSVVTKIFLENADNDGFIIRGTVRDKNNAKRLQPLKDAYGPLFDKLELVNADLNNEQSISEAIKGATYVIHTASPFPIENPKNPKRDVLDPAINGTLYVCNAAAAHGVKRLVITSSIYSMCFSADKNKVHLDESSWTDEKRCDTYALSKTLAEKAAWKHQKDTGNKYELAIINPGLIVGRPLIQGDYAVAQLMKMFMTNTGMPGLPKMSVGITGLEDCAMAHYKAMVVPEAAGRRFLMAEKVYWMSDVAGWCTKKYGPMGYKTMQKTMGVFPLNCLACCVFQAKIFMQEYGKQYQIDNNLAQQMLGIQFKPIEQCTYECVDQLIANGYIPKA